MRALSDDSDDSEVGRPTIEDSWLSSNRDALLNMLSCWWADVGWQLTTAKVREQLRNAFDPVKDHPNKNLINRLVRPTQVSATATEIRKKRKSLGIAVAEMRAVDSHRDECVKGCRDIECAMCGARPEQRDFILRELSTRRTVCQAAQDQSRTAVAAEQALENELLDMEAAFAQGGLLEFITKAKYKLYPLNLANAMAGLPNAFGVEFIGVWVSHARCSKLVPSGWPSYHYQIFETIESIWETSKECSVSIVEFFRKQIELLPTRVSETHPTLGTRKVENYVRSHLSKNFWDLQRAIERSLQTQNDPRPMHFIIASNLDKCIGEPKTFADLAEAKAARIPD